MSKIKIEVELRVEVVQLLAVLCDDEKKSPVQRAVRALEQLADHAQQGVYRPGAWEREWLKQAFGDSFVARLEPGDPYGRAYDGSERLFERPKRGGRK